MKQLYKILYLLIITSVSISITSGQNFHVLDINHSKDGNPFNNSLFDPQAQQQYDFLNGEFEYAVLDGVAYFTADDGLHGAELWRSDGTAQGTKMVKDIFSGTTSSNVRAITVSGNKIFFRADDGINGSEIWVSDGTNAGTFMVKDISPFGSSSPSYLTDVNGILYFFANNISNADQLWKTDGTSNGTIMVADFFSPQFNYSDAASQLTKVGGHLFFVLNQYYNAEIYTSDGTSAGTHLVKDINPFGSSNPANLTAVNGLLYFAADDGTGKRLWISDGTETGTYMANNPANIFVDDFFGIKFTIKSNTIYFSGNIPDSDGSRLCAYNTSDASNNIKVVKDINPGVFCYNLYNITNVSGTLFFTVFNGTDQVLWKSNGTGAGTQQVIDIDPGKRNIYLYKDFVNANGTLLFSFYDDAHGYEIWKSDGTEPGTVMIKEINPGVYSSNVANITYLENNISLFAATDGKTGLELWKTDGTEQGTALVKNINQTSTGSSSPFMLTQNADKSKLLFVANEPQHGTELNITDGTQEGTHVVKDLFKGSFSSYPYYPVNFKNKTYFFASILDTAFHNTSDIRTLNKLCKTDGSNTGTVVLSLPSLEAAINSNSYVSAVEAASNLLYLLLYNYSTSQYELWRTDGTGAGTYPVKTDMASFYNLNLKAVDDLLFFTNYDFTYGSELWISDGSTQGTKMVKDIAPGFNSSNPSGLAAFNGKLYFTADYGYGPFIWTSDGTENGTRVLKPAMISYNQFAQGSSFVQANGKLFFSAIRNVGHGTELYATDGTDTKLVKDIYHGPGSSNIYNLVGGDTIAYFIADDGKHGMEIWKSNGTKEGTSLVKNITPDINSTYPGNMTTVHNELFFTINDALWQSDGTKKGTHAVDDVNLAGVMYLNNFAAFDNKLAFTAFESSTGYELYVGDAGSEIFAIDKSSDAPVIKSNLPSFGASIYPNPVHTKATLQFTGDVKNAAVTIADVSGKIIWQNVYTNQLRIDLPAEKLAAGIYMVTIKTNTESKTIKLVKQ